MTSILVVAATWANELVFYCEIGGFFSSLDQWPAEYEMPTSSPFMPKWVICITDDTEEILIANVVKTMKIQSEPAIIRIVTFMAMVGSASDLSAKMLPTMKKHEIYAAMEFNHGMLMRYRKVGPYAGNVILPVPTNMIENIDEKVAKYFEEAIPFDPLTELLDRMDKLPGVIFDLTFGQAEKSSIIAYCHKTHRKIVNGHALPVGTLKSFPSLFFSVNIKDKIKTMIRDGVHITDLIDFVRGEEPIFLQLSDILMSDAILTLLSEM